MIKLEEIKRWFDNLNGIIFDMNVAIENIRRITHPEDKYEKIILKHGFFSHYYFQARFTIIIQLCKIFSDNKNQKRNVYKFFNRITSDAYDEEFKKKLKGNIGISHLFSTRKEIQDDIELIRGEIADHNELILKVVTLRNKCFAHSDPEQELPKVTNTELEILVKLAISIYNKIYGNLYNVTFLFDVNSEWRVEYPIKVLSSIKRETIENLENDIKHKPSQSL
jgi:AbiU2